MKIPTSRSVPQSSTPTIEQSQAQPEIVCPVLRGMVDDGHLHMDENGDAKLSELRDIFEDLGFSRHLANLAVVGNSAGSILGNIFSGTFNLNELRGGLLDHSGDSMVLRKGSFDPEKFEALIQHSQDGKRMTKADFESAIAENKKIDNASSMGSRISKIEFSILLQAFGTEGPDGTVGISIDELRGLYENKDIPASFRPESNVKANNPISSMAQNVRGLALGSQTGIAQAGVNSALGGGDLLEGGQLGSLGVGKGVCPHMGAAGEVTTSANQAEITQLHNQIEHLNIAPK